MAGFEGTVIDNLSGARQSAPHPLAAGYFLVFAALALLVIGIALWGDAADGDPVVVLALEPALQGETPDETVTAPVEDGAQPEPQPIVVGGNLVVDPALVEVTPDGPLPRIAADGRMPMRAYARPFDLSDQRPRVAVVIAGLGVSASTTQLALEALPGGVTLAFAPYASDVQRWVIVARERGHEVLVEVPMEPFDFPESDPGPHTLLTTASSGENAARLAWAMSRFAGYVGITNLLGGRFLGDTAAVEPVLRTVKRRGLLFFNNTATPHSAAEIAAADLDVPYAGGALVLDAVQSKSEIDARLAELEARARETGQAAASGFLFPVTVERVAAWADTLESKGLVLAPVSAIVGSAD